MATAVIYRAHGVKRDDAERYIIIYGRGDIAILDAVTGLQVNTINITAAAASYMTSGNPTADDMRLVSIADFTILLNRKVTAATVRTPSASFVVTAAFDTYADMVSQPSPANNAHYRVLNDDAVNLAGFYKYVQSSQTVTGDQAKWVTQIMPNAFKAHGSNWKNHSFNTTGIGGGFRIRFKRFNAAHNVLAYDATGNGEGEHHLSLTGAFANYTAQAGDEIHIIAGGADTLPAGWYPIFSRVDADAILLADNGSSGVNYRTEADDAIATYPDSSDDKADSDSDYISVSGNMIENFRTSKPQSMNDIAQRIETKIQANTGLENALVGYDAANLQFTFRSPFQGDEATVVNLTDPDSGLDWSATVDEPFQFSAGVATAGTGATQGETDVDDRWLQVPAPGEGSAQINPNTMPIKIVRTSLSPVTFDVDVIAWKDRLSGDENTNPAPPFLVDENGDASGKTLSDVSFHRNRLAISADEIMSFGQVGDFFNFFATSAGNIVDSDPVNRSLTSDQVTIVEFMIPFRKSMVIFTAAGRQFELNAPEEFSDKTVAITPTTSYDSSPAVKPSKLNDSIFFTGPDGLRTKLFDYRFVDQLATSEARDVTSHTPELMPTAIKTIVTHANTGTVFVLPKEDNVVYWYRQYREGARRDQQALSKWTLHANIQIDDIVIIDDVLYAVFFDTVTGKRTYESIDVSQSVVSIDADGLQNLPTPSC